MRITFILPGYPWRPVGGYRVVYEYANHLVAKGHDVTVVHPRKMRQTPRPVGLYQVFRTAAKRGRDFLLRPKLEWQWLDPRVKMVYVREPIAQYVPDGDVVFATAWQTAEYVAKYPLSKGRKFYLIQAYEIWGGPKAQVDATWRFPMKKVVIAKWLFEKGLELGVPAEEMRHIPNGIDLKKFHITTDITNRPRRVSMLYSNTEWKGSVDGIRALEVVKKEFPELRTVFFGTPSRPASLPDWIEYYKNPPQETLVEEIYNGSSIFLCPSWTEGWGLPGAEAMACGCALVSTDTGGVHDYAIHNETALLSPPRDPQALAENLCRLLNDDILRVRLAEAGCANIQYFTWDRATEALLEFITSG
ncbi:D-inositol-3-phosphate glycosyltransferase [Neomoorella glycerini]|uniref:D-inositol-3-phosphate glycosyltransferase n=1 Tax=Neomoorella glycerini TaxID=55779 RepID=A0A6I5ZS52_9FIRM|nr:glycosyltransferase family 4 protein [Moorella glycerini]QGP92670.1 D-inositol-3-phosphate glycosyltransferase [Moorella glycerini]